MKITFNTTTAVEVTIGISRVFFWWYLCKHLYQHGLQVARDNKCKQVA